MRLSQVARIATEAYVRNRGLSLRFRQPRLDPPRPVICEVFGVADRAGHRLGRCQGHRGRRRLPPLLSDRRVCEELDWSASARRWPGWASTRGCSTTSVGRGCHRTATWPWAARMFCGDSGGWTVSSGLTKHTHRAQGRPVLGGRFVRVLLTRSKAYCNRLLLLFVLHRAD